MKLTIVQIVLFVFTSTCQEVKNELNPKGNNKDDLVNFNYNHLEAILKEYVKDRDGFKKLISKNIKRDLDQAIALKRNLKQVSRCKRDASGFGETICVTKHDVDELKGRVLLENNQIENLRVELKKLQHLVQLIRDQQLLLSVLNEKSPSKNDTNEVDQPQQRNLQNQLEALNATVSKVFKKEQDEVSSLKKELEEFVISTKSNRNGTEIVKELSKQRDEIRSLRQMLIGINQTEATKDKVNQTSTTVEGGVNKTSTLTNVSEPILTAAPMKYMLGVSDDDEEVADLEELIRTEHGIEDDRLDRNPKLLKARESNSDSLFTKFLKSLDSTEDDNTSDDLQAKVVKLERELKKNKKTEEQLVKLLKTMKKMVDDKESRTDDVDLPKKCQPQKEGKDLTENEDVIERELISLQKAIDQLRPKEETDELNNLQKAIDRFRPKEETSSLDQNKQFQIMLSKLLTTAPKPQPPPPKQINPNDFEVMLKKLLPTLIEQMNYKQNGGYGSGYQENPKPFPYQPNRPHYKKPFFMAPQYPKPPIVPFEIENPYENALPPPIINNNEKEFMQNFPEDDYEYGPQTDDLYRQSNFFRSMRNNKPPIEAAAGGRPQLYGDPPQNQRLGDRDVKKKVNEVNSRINHLHDAINNLDQSKTSKNQLKESNHFGGIRNQADMKIRHRRSVGEPDDDVFQGVSELFGDAIDSELDYNDIKQKPQPVYNDPNLLQHEDESLNYNNVQRHEPSRYYNNKQRHGPLRYYNDQQHGPSKYYNDDHQYHNDQDQRHEPQPGIGYNDQNLLVHEPLQYHTKDVLHEKLLNLKNQLDLKINKLDDSSPYSEPRYAEQNIIDIKKSKKLEIFEKIVNLIADKILVAVPILMKKLFGLSFDDDYSSPGGYGYNQYNYGLSKIFKSLGLFGYLPLAIMKLLNVFSYVISALRKNKFIRDFLVPILIIGVIAGSVVFLIWWLQLGDDANQSKYGLSYGYNNYNNYDTDYNNANYEPNVQHYNNGNNKYT